MATSAFKSTTKRTPIGKSDSDGSAASSHRRSRSLSRFSRPITSAEEDSGGPTPSRGKFVNTVRGSEISLDDLAVDFSRISDSSGGNGATPALQRRGRSVSRRGSTRVAEIGNDGRGSVGNNSGGGRVVSETISRRRRSMSVVRYRVSDYESDLDNSKEYIHQTNPERVGTATNTTFSSNKSTTLNHRQGLRRSLSQRDLKPNNGYSAEYHSTGVKGGLYQAMRKELRHAVEEIKMELGQAVGKNTSDSDRLQSNSSHALQDASTFRRNHATSLKLSEKRTQELFTELVLEEQPRRDISKIVNKLLPNSKNNVDVDKPSRPRRRSNDRSRMSRRLTEEAEKYFEDFISNVEDTDISSLDGERSDTSSVVGGKPRLETFQSPPVSKAPLVEMDGVVLPWLQWETDPSPQSCNSKMQQPSSIRTALRHQETGNAQDDNIHSPSSRGSWSPEVVNVPSVRHYDGSQNPSLSGEPGLHYDTDEYLKPPTSEEQLMERCRRLERINSGSLLLCNHNYTFF